MTGKGLVLPSLMLAAVLAVSGTSPAAASMVVGSVVADGVGALGWAVLVLAWLSEAWPQRRTTTALPTRITGPMAACRIGFGGATVGIGGPASAQPDGSPKRRPLLSRYICNTRPAKCMYCSCRR